MCRPGSTWLNDNLWKVGATKPDKRKSLSMPIQACVAAKAMVRDWSRKSMTAQILFILPGRSELEHVRFAFYSYGFNFEWVLHALIDETTTSD